MVIKWLKDRGERRKKAQALYLAAATQARSPVFYQALGVPDSLDGRFEMTSLHVFLLMNALRHRADKPARALSQALFDRMFRVTDQAIREMGVGDLSVPRHMKRMMKAFNGRAYAYGQALDANDTGALEDALRRNVYGTAPQVEPDQMAALIAYLRAAHALIEAGAVMDGQPVFPPMGEAPTDIQAGEERHYG